MMLNKHQIPELDRKGLREFALVTGGIIAVLFGVALPWLFDIGWPTWPWIFAGVLISIGIIAPRSLRPIYRGWMRFGLLISKVTTPVILGLVFFLVITPIGLIRRIGSGDTHFQKPEESNTYRIRSEKTPAKNMERPF